jgi:transcriptional regulator with XRE-family HTH domain
LYGMRIRQLRIKEGLTQEELGESLGVSKVAISQYENETRNPSNDILIKLSRKFGVSVDYILGVTSDLCREPESEYNSKDEDPELEILFRDLKELDANDRAIIMAIARERKRQREQSSQGKESRREDN